jgi:predicted 3-demethylubiquinone-9 3-methyltransferase (glyoxalase superfamily)
MINLAGFIIGNGYTTGYQDSNVWFPETLVNLNLISQELYSSIQANQCVWYWDKFGITPHVNAPACEDLFNQWNA